MLLQVSSVFDVGKIVYQMQLNKLSIEIASKTECRCGRPERKYQTRTWRESEKLQLGVTKRFRSKKLLCSKFTFVVYRYVYVVFNPLNTELNPICQ